MVEFELDKVTHFYLIDTLITGNWDAFWDVLTHLILPAVTLGLLISGVLIRLVRVNLLQTMRGDYVEAARARGVTERRVVDQPRLPQRARPGGHGRRAFSSRSCSAARCSPSRPSTGPGSAPSSSAT